MSKKYNETAVLDATKNFPSIDSAAQGLGIPRTTLQYMVNRNGGFGKLKAAKKTVKTRKINKPKAGRIKRFIFSSAQDATQVDEAFLRNLEAYAQWLGDCEIHIGGYTYNKSLFTDHSSARATFDSRIAQYMTNHQFDVANALLFCGEINTLPTAVRPLSGFETYTRSKWGVFPHPRITMQSIATENSKRGKIIMTTGSVTKANYIPKKAGIRAEFHHVIGAVLVEVDSDGDVFCRHLIAEKDGSFQDLTNHVSNGEITTDHRVEAITWGDIHHEMLDRDVAFGAWGFGAGNADPICMLDELEPHTQFFHDLADFRARTHHNVSNPHLMYEMFVENTENVEEALKGAAEFLISTRRDWCHTVIVESNHDLMLSRWLREADYRRDPVNAKFFLECQLAMYEAIKRKDKRFSIFEHVMNRVPDTQKMTFLRESDSFIICPHAGGGIENAIHGHLGANGAKGHILAYTRMGPKANVAHTHSAAIEEGIYQAGTSSKLNLGYNRGLSSWNHSHIVTYSSGKRVVITMRGKKWRATA